MATGPAEYLVTISRFGYEQPSEPFHLEGAMGTVLTLVSATFRRVTMRVASWSSRRDHIVSTSREEMLFGGNSGSIRRRRRSDPGAAGLRNSSAGRGGAPTAFAGRSIDAESIDQSSPGNVALGGKGPLPPGESMVQFHFMLRHTGELQFRQPASLAIQDLRRHRKAS